MFFDSVPKVMYFLIIIIIYYGLFYEKMYFLENKHQGETVFLKKKTSKNLLN